jgi:hypothetical protein
MFPKNVKTCHNINIKSETLSRVTATQFLGVIVDEKLTWHNNIDSI